MLTPRIEFKYLIYNYEKTTEYCLSLDDHGPLTWCPNDSLKNLLNQRCHLSQAKYVPAKLHREPKCFWRIRHSYLVKSAISSTWCFFYHESNTQRSLINQAYCIDLIQYSKWGWITYLKVIEQFIEGIAFRGVQDQNTRKPKLGYSFKSAEPTKSDWSISFIKQFNLAFSILKFKLE